MKILVANERLLFRFGLDRVLVLIAQHCRDVGHTLSFLVRDFDQEVLLEYSDHIIPVPRGESAYLNINEHVASWLESHWDDVFSDDSVPDIVICGGWPFYCSIPIFRAHGVEVIVVDGGAVPLDGFSGPALEIQQKVRELRRMYLPHASMLLPISHFLARTQSKLDAPNVPYQILYCGADHMESSGVWGVFDREALSIKIIEYLRTKNLNIILSLGRWEQNNYKNSVATFEYIRALKTIRQDFRVLVLESEETVNAPDDVADYIVFLGYINDADLQRVMQSSDIGVCFSLWEGFNLPLAEMQWLSRPTFVFDVGAHPEVVVEPRFMCRDSDEMVKKTSLALDQPDKWATKSSAMARFRSKFTWANTYQKLDAAVDDVLSMRKSSKEYLASNTVADTAFIIDVTNSAHDPANSGVIRVTRRFSRELQKFVQPIFVIWDESSKQYTFPTAGEFDQLGQFHGPRRDSDHIVSTDRRRICLVDQLFKFPQANKWLLICETASKDALAHIVPFALEHGMRIGAIFYDAIALLYPELCSKSVRDSHVGYMSALNSFDIIFPISGYSKACLENYYRDKGLNLPEIVENLLPGEFGDGGREILFARDGTKINILCVSTLEPRKNHRRLIDAVNRLQARRPDIDWSLTLVGNKYAGAFDLAEWVEAQCAANPRIRWLGIVSDEMLQDLYRKADFTVYPSVVEGYGMPIVESLWYGRPCLCSNDGVMAELAAAGGCLTVDVTDGEAIYLGLERLCTDAALRLDLGEKAKNRVFKTWNQYTQIFLAGLLAVTPGDSTLPQLTAAKDHKVAREKPLLEDSGASDWRKLLYEGCLTDKWQMSDSERVGMMGVLARVKPRCAIEVGTYEGGSLSLISQFADIVFSIDVDPEIPQKFKQFTNVSFLTGRSQLVLPRLLEEIDRSSMPLDFILIDGDHSSEGVRQDLNIILRYKPRSPLVVMLHDSFNPGCRAGMLNADWGNAPHVHWADLDFIPGRVIEHGGSGSGETWGGLALIYLAPAVRFGNFVPGRSSDKMLQSLLDQQLAGASSGDC